MKGFSYPILSLCLFFVSVHSFSQDFQFQVRVIDSADHQPVSFVTIYINEYQGTISDELGYFRIHTSPDQFNDSLHLSCIGYHSISMSLSELNTLSLDTIYLTQNLIEFDEVTVKGKSRKAPKSKQILRTAIKTIPTIYPDEPIKLRGYYREYIKQEDQYINLLESIIELRDPGIGNKDEFSAGLLFKRTRPEFEIDNELMRPYDNYSKFVPYTIAPTKTPNELALLRSHDPVRNHDQPALYYIDCLKSKFIGNHYFDPPQLTYLRDRPYYSIVFRDKMSSTSDQTRVAAEGEIFVDVLNHGIKKLKYKVFTKTGIYKQKLLDLSLEYKLDNDLYYLSYLSFNNLFHTRNFAIDNIFLNEDHLDIYLSRPFDIETLGKANFKVFWKGNEMELEKVDAGKLENQFKIYLDRGYEIYYDRISKNLKIEIDGLKDRDGNSISNNKLSDYYQYRELFIRDFSTTNTSIEQNLINELNPVFESHIFGDMIKDTLWMNTPLITEQTRTKTIKTKNPVLQSGIENLSHRNDKSVNETVYIHTDREVYAPADTIWFKAYIRDLRNLHNSQISQTLFVGLADSNGEIIEEQRLFVENSDSHGQFILNHRLQEGIYHLTAYSSWMKNFSVDQLYSKRILIRDDQRNGRQLLVSYDKPSYVLGDTIRFNIHCLDELNRVVDNVKYSYRIKDENETYQKGSASTTQTFSDSLLIVIPDQLSEIPSIQIKGSHKGQVLDTSFRLPVIKDLGVGFFPEGGHSIYGLTGKISFKVQNLQGAPFDIRGRIVDQKGAIVTTAITEHDGMGAFSVTPDQGQQLFLKLTYPKGIDKLYPVPEAIEKGWLLSGKSSGRNIRLKLNRFNTKNDVALITVMVRGYLSYYKEVRVKNSTTISIPAEKIPPGIAVVTLFDSEMIPRAEKLLYIQPSEESEFRIGTNRSTYVPRDKVRLDLKILTEDLAESKGSYSLSVVDNQLCSSDFLNEANIRTSFLLSPEIKGSIHNPNYYLNSHDPEVMGHLELLLSTQGWRNYSIINGTDWAKQVNNPSDRETISGTLLKQPYGRELSPSAGEINVYFGGNSTRIPIDQTGQFNFKPLYDLKNNSGVLLTGFSDLRSSDAQLQVDSTSFEKTLINYLHILADSSKRSINVPIIQYVSFSENFSLGQTYSQWIEEVEIVRARNRSQDETEELFMEDLLFNTKEARSDDLESSIDLLGTLYNMGIQVDYDPVNGVLIHMMNPQSVIGWVVDDIYYGISYRDIEDIRPQHIEKLFVVKNTDTQYFGMNVPEVIVSIKLKKYKPEENVGYTSSKYSIEKFAVSKEFYKPLYDTDIKRKTTIPDLRRTIHWDPNIKIGEDGSTTIEFYNGDRYTKLKCIVEGITHTGVPVYSEYTYDVTLMGN